MAPHGAKKVHSIEDTGMPFLAKIRFQPPGRIAEENARKY